MASSNFFTSYSDTNNTDTKAGTSYLTYALKKCTGSGTGCTTSEVALTTDFEKQDFYVFCDAIQRSIITGVALAIECTVKIDMNNTAIQNTLANIHTLISQGTVAQFNNVMVQFELITNVESNVLTYTKYNVPVNMKISDLGGAAEDEGEYALELVINGKGTVVSD